MAFVNWCSIFKILFETKMKHFWALIFSHIQRTCRWSFWNKVKNYAIWKNRNMKIETFICLTFLLILLKCLIWPVVTKWGGAMSQDQQQWCGTVYRLGATTIYLCDTILVQGSVKILILSRLWQRILAAILRGQRWTQFYRQESLTKRDSIK